jgi:CNT family concentrative nucleoside transporter
MMTGGMATVAGGVLAAYVGFGIDAGHLLAASVMAAPAALVLAKLFIPETEESQTVGVVKLKVEKTHSNIIEAAAAGAGEGFN